MKGLLLLAKAQELRDDSAQDAALVRLFLVNLGGVSDALDQDAVLPEFALVSEYQLIRIVDLAEPDLLRFGVHFGVKDARDEAAILINRIGLTLFDR